MLLETLAWPLVAPASSMDSEEVVRVHLALESVALLLHNCRYADAFVSGVDDEQVNQGSDRILASFNSVAFLVKRIFHNLAGCHR